LGALHPVNDTVALGIRRAASPNCHTRIGCELLERVQMSLSASLAACALALTS
jgi:hypothetical protein